MKIKRMAVHLNGNAVRKKAKQLLALSLAVLMLNPGTGYGLAAHAQETVPAATQEVKSIQAFAPLPAEIASQQLAAGATAAEIQLPSTLAATVAVLPAATAAPEATTAPEATVAPEATATPAATSAPAATAPAETTQAITLENISWAIDAASSTCSTFTPGAGGAHYTYLPTLPAGYTLAGGVALPQITVQVSAAGAAVGMTRMEDAPAAYDSWLTATAVGVTPAVGDTITINGVVATYKGDISTTGLETTNSDYKNDGSAEIYKAGAGYVLLIWPTGAGMLQLTMHDAVISNEAAGTNALSIFAQLNVTLEGNNAITTARSGLQSTNSNPNLTIGGDGALQVNAGHDVNCYAISSLYMGMPTDTLTVQGNVHLTLAGATGMSSGTIIIKGNSVVDIAATTAALSNNTFDGTESVRDNAKVTATGASPFFVTYNPISVDSSASLNGIKKQGEAYTVYGAATVEEQTILDLSGATSINLQPGASIINKGTLKLPAGCTSADIAALHITGSGILQVGGKPVAVVNGVLYAVGPDASGGLDLQTTPVTEATWYQAGSGYALFTPSDGISPATLVLHNAQISSSAFQALFLDTKTVIRLEGANSIENTAVDTHCVGIIAYSTGGVPQPIMITGGSGDSLLVSAWQCTYGISNLTVSGASVTMRSTCYGLLTEGDVLLENGAKLSVKGGESGNALMIGQDLGHGSFSSLTLSGGSALTVDGESLITGNLSIGSGSTVTVQEDDLFVVNRALFITNSGTVYGNGLFILPYNYTAAQVQALRLPGTVKLVEEGTRKSRVYVDGAIYADGGILGKSLNLKVPPEEETYYKVDSGTHNCYIIYTPAQSGKAAVLTLHDVNNMGYLINGIILPNEPVTLRLWGYNAISNITASNHLAVLGDGQLYCDIYNTNGAAALTVNSGATLNAKYQTEMSGVTVYTIYGRYSGGIQLDPDEKLILAPGATLVVQFSNILMFRKNTSYDNWVLGAGASIVNDSVVVLPQGTTPGQIAALPLKGIGVVFVPTSYDGYGDPVAWDTYNNDGVALKMISAGESGLDLTKGDNSGKTVEKDGYAWNTSSKTLTLGSACVLGNIILPSGATVITTGPAVVQGRIAGETGRSLNLAFSGTAPLNIIGGISGGIDDDTVTFEGGAQVTIGSSVFLGASGGTGGTLNVSGTGTRVTVSSAYGYAVMCDTVNLQNGAALTANGDTFGVEALTGVNVTGGAVLTTNCDYGVYIIGGKLTVDDTSKLVTNGAIAPFCIVDATSKKTQSEVLSLPSIPAGTQVAVAIGEQGKYWSLAPVNGSLSVANENNTPVTLAGAKTGTLTFVKPAAGGDGTNGGSSNGTGGAGTAGGTGTPTVVLGTAGKTTKTPRRSASGVSSDTSSSVSSSTSSSAAQAKDETASSSSAASASQSSGAKPVEKQLSTIWLILLIILLIAAVTVGYLVYRRKKRQ